MSLSEIISEAKDQLSSIKYIDVFGVILVPFYQNKSMACYTSLDLSNPGLLELNEIIFGGYLKVPCIHSKQYSIRNNNKCIRKKAIKEDCNNCKFTPIKADYFDIIIYCSFNEDSTIRSKLSSDISNAINKVNNKFNINIKNCKLNLKGKEIGVSE